MLSGGSGLAVTVVPQQVWGPPGPREAVLSWREESLWWARWALLGFHGFVAHSVTHLPA